VVEQVDGEEAPHRVPLEVVHPAHLEVAHRVRGVVPAEIQEIQGNKLRFSASRYSLTDWYRSSSGISPSFGRGGNKYAGGATTPFRAGSASPIRRIAPFLLLGGALTFFPGVWLYGAYIYPYTSPYNFINRTDVANAINETLPVTCLCAAYSACGCDEDEDSSYLDTIIGNGSVAALNRTLVNIAAVNNTKTIILNGTLPNGTDTASASGSSAPISAATSKQRMMEAGGFWVVGFIVAATVWVL
jgi:hypothetical protein